MRFLIVLATLLLFSCDQDINEVQIRVKNNNSFNYDKVTLGTPGGEFIYTSLDGGGATKYDLHSSAYRYGYVEVVIDQDTFTYQPIDYVGERLLSSGKYTYLLTIDKTNPGYSGIRLELVVD